MVPWYMSSLDHFPLLLSLLSLPVASLLSFLIKAIRKNIFVKKKMFFKYVPEA